MVAVCLCLCLNFFETVVWNCSNCPTQLLLLERSNYVNSFRNQRHEFLPPQTITALDLSVLYLTWIKYEHLGAASLLQFLFGSKSNRSECFTRWIARRLFMNEIAPDWSGSTRFCLWMRRWCSCGCRYGAHDMSVSGKADAAETDLVASEVVSASDRQLTDMVWLFVFDTTIIISGFGIYGAAVVPDSGVGNTWQCLALVLHEFLSTGLTPSRLHIVISFLTHAHHVFLGLPRSLVPGSPKRVMEWHAVRARTT